MMHLTTVGVVLPGASHETAMASPSDPEATTDTSESEPDDENERSENRAADTGTHLLCSPSSVHPLGRTGATAYTWKSDLPHGLTVTFDAPTETVLVVLASYTAYFAEAAFRPINPWTSSRTRHCRKVQVSTIYWLPEYCIRAK